MKYFTFLITILFLTLLIPKISFSTTLYSIASGSWGNAATWSLGRPPACGDTIYISPGHIVSIVTDQDYSEPTCTLSMFVIVDSLGTINFATNGRRLRLPCNSGFIIEPGGNLIATGNGGGNSTFLEICDSEVWRKSDGPRTGPLVYGTPLPIELLSFEATLNKDKVDLKWITSVEINNNFFTIEKSQNTKDWEVSSTLSGAGNSNQIVEYFDVDYSPSIGVSYYRLKQTDYDGKFSYSNIVPVNYFESNTGGNINLFPNPVKSGETVSLKFQNIFESEILVVIRDIQGKEYYSKVFVNIEDGKLIGIPVESAIPGGIYLVTATSENQIYSQKLIVR